MATPQPLAAQPGQRRDSDPQLLALKVPPHSVEAEQSLLGGLLLDNQAFDRVADLVTGEDFYRDDHRRLWRHIQKLVEASRPADVVTVAESIEASEDKDKTGGPAYLAALAQNTPSSANIRRYAELVRERSVQRRLAQVATEIAESALAPTGKEVGQLLDEAESKIFQIAESGARKDQGLIGISPILARVYERVDHLYHQDNPSDVTGVPTGFGDLDQKTAGLQPGDLIIIAGRPSMGKTAFALNIAEHAALEAHTGVAVFSLEMSKEQLVFRMLCSEARVDQSKVRAGYAAQRDYPKLAIAADRLSEAAIYIDDTPALSVLELRAKARRLKRERDANLGLVIVDYLQLMRGTSSDSREQEISSISRSLKALAKELGVPVMALSQLNRQVESRGDKRPVMADLRESGAIEQDADVIMFLFRPVVYDPKNADEHDGEVIIGKQRNGPTGTVSLTFFPEYTRFENRAADEVSFEAEIDEL